MRKFLYIVLFVFLCAQGSAQNIALAKADKLYYMYAYSDAIESYEKLLKKSPGDDYIIQQLAFSYQKVGLYVQALDYYGEHVKSERATYEDQFQYGMLLLTDLQLDAAIAQFEKCMQLNATDKRPAEQIARIESFGKMNQTQLVNEVIDMSFNTRFADMCPAFFNDTIAFVSARDSSGGATYSWNNQPFLDIYEIAPNKKGKIEIQKMPGVNTKYHEGSLTFTDNDNTIWFTRNDLAVSKISGEETNILKIYTAQWNGKRWKNVQEFQYNGDDYSVGHPVFSADGKTMYFASNMPGSFGETDLYKVTQIEVQDKKGEKHIEWSEPENLGTQFNTKGKEMFPFIDSRGVLFFASDGLSGFGGLDIFAAFPVADTFNIINLGQPINSTYDDFGLIVKDNFSEGYFSSNRPDGVGSDDIYAFHIGKQNFLVKVKALSDGSPISNAQILYTVDDKTETAGVTDDNGEAWIKIDHNKNCYIEAKNDYYIANTDSLLAFEIFELPEHSKTIYLTKSDTKPEKETFIEPVVESEPQVQTVAETVVKSESEVDIESKVDSILDVEPEPVPEVLIESEPVEKPEPQVLIDSVPETESQPQLQSEPELQPSFLELLVLNEENNNPVAGVGVAITLPDKQILTKKTDEFGTVLLSVDQLGTISVYYKKDGFVSETSSVVISAGEGNYSDTIKLVSVYEGKTIILDNLYYDVNSSYIRADAALRLNALCQLLIEYPNMKIELSSHTDSRSDAKYNQWLSQRRAQSAVNYIISKGISADRMQAAGYGESRLLNHCADGVECSEEEHQQNRRTEIKILEF